MNRAAHGLPMPAGRVAVSMRARKVRVNRQPLGTSPVREHMQSHKKFADYVPPTQIAYVDGRPATLHLRKCRIIVHAEAGSHAVEFDQGVVTLGAMEDNDLTLRDPTVSRYHGRIVQEASGYVLVDLGSTNGSFIDGVRIREAYLSPGCEINLGQCRMTFQAFDEEVEIHASQAEHFGDIIGRDLRMREIFGMLEKIAPTAATVVIEGETGTGKEVVAQTIHKTSQRADEPFVVFDCGAVPGSLIESELFGHEKGSFTGATMTRQGLFEMAQGGTIFLDELGELSLDLQPKLLRVLEQREVRRVGSGKSIPIDVRVIAATNRDLEEEVRQGRFREDLFYRLSVVRLILPPLRKRPDDIPLLIDFFLKNHKYNRDASGNMRFRRLSARAMQALVAYRWPGNVRELLNAIERACSFASGDMIELEDLPETVIGSDDMTTEQPSPSALIDAYDSRERLQSMPFKEAKEEWVSSFEKDYLVSLLERNGNNISHAAREASIDRKYFRKLMKKYQIVI